MMGVHKTETCTFRCDACGQQIGPSYTSVPALLIAQAEMQTHVNEDDNSGFCDRCMKIYRTVALSLIPEAFETKEVAP